MRATRTEKPWSWSPLPLLWGFPSRRRGCQLAACPCGGGHVGQAEKKGDGGDPLPGVGGRLDSVLWAPGRPPGRLDSPAGATAGLWCAGATAVPSLGGNATGQVVGPSGAGLRLAHRLAVFVGGPGLAPDGGRFRRPLV